MAGLDHRQLDLVLLGELVEQRDHAAGRRRRRRCPSARRRRAPGSCCRAAPWPPRHRRPPPAGGLDRGAAAGGAGCWRGGRRGRRRRPASAPGATSSAFAGVMTASASGMSLVSGMSLASSLILETASLTSSACLVFGILGGRDLVGRLLAGVRLRLLGGAAVLGLGRLLGGGGDLLGVDGRGRRRRRRRRSGTGLGGARRRPRHPRRAVGGIGRAVAVGGRRRRLGRRRRPGERALEVQRRAEGGEVDLAEDVADHPGHVLDVRHHVLAELVDAHALHGGGHHHAGQAGLRLAVLQRHHRLARPERHLVGELVQPGVAARGRGVAPELGAERRVAEQSLDQLGGDVGFGRRPRLTLRALASSSGLASTTIAGMKNATQRVISTVQTT